jgi:hypothetical protein
MHASTAINSTTSSRNDSTAMGSINDAIALLRSSDGPYIAAVARRLEVNRTTLGKRFRGKTGSLARRIKAQRLLTHKQEQALIK